MSKAFDDWFHQEYNQFYSHDSFMDIDIREAFQAGRAYQREVDAKIAEKTVVGIDDNGLYNDPLEEVAKAIREQKIDD